MVFFTMYLLTILGNLAILFCIVYDQHLHLPMYYFLSNLSLVDICLTSSTISTLLSSLFFNHLLVSFPSCIAQMYCFVSFGNLENNLLAVMAYDRYVAICSPLQYYMKMKHRLCIALVFLSWVAACLHSLLHTLMVATLEYTGVKQVNHFFCEISQVLAISDSDTSVNFLLIFTEGAVSVGAPFICIIMSYFCIVRTIVQMHSADGRSKAFSTCSSHLTAVCLFYGTIAAVYFLPSTTASLLNGRLATIGHTLLTPLLNPFIYGLRNKAIKTVFRKLFLGKLRHMFIRINDYN
ncbi:olfactory receptor 1361 [Xenopus tropicalis]|uniref:Olfactory receptor 1361 n=1 Tax=Xenopus tropicalis TaxID=8364 RepID=A0A8J0SW33_XENTR|nr:olfactory receptor 1361 [Xenopus tropicalis]